MEQYNSLVESEMNARDHFKNRKNLIGRANFFILTLFLSCISICAQDVITLRNGDEIKAKVTEISSNEIKYKRWFEKSDGPTIVISSADVFFIDYEGGTREIITSLNESITARTTIIAKKQANNNRLLRELTKKGNKIYFITEAVDPAENSEQTIKYIKDTFFPQLHKDIANFSYWKIVNDIQDADFVLVYTWFKIYGYDAYSARVLFFDNQMNFLYTPVTGLTLKKMASHLQKADLSKASPFYVETKSAKKFDEVKFAQYYQLLMESVHYKQNKLILEYADKCISINPEFPELYEIKMAALLDMNKKTKKTFTKWVELEPLHQNIELFWQFAGNQNLKRQERNARIWTAVAISMGAAATTYAAIQSSSSANTSSSANNASTLSSASSQNSGQRGSLKDIPCSYCGGSGKNPATERIDYGTDSGTQYGTPHCSHPLCNDITRHYHKSCPSCAGRGYNQRFVYN